MLYPVGEAVNPDSLASVIRFMLPISAMATDGRDHPLPPPMNDVPPDPPPMTPPDPPHDATSIPTNLPTQDQGGGGVSNQVVFGLCRILK
jgi:hypothetical protein